MWVHTFCVVAFDEDLGQKLELQYPPVLSEAEQRAVAFLSFPDSNSFNAVGDMEYLFRMRKGSPYTESPIPLSSCSTQDHTFYYGFVFFRQCRDASKPRGYFQKSLVVITPHAYVSLFKQVITIMGPLYFAHGESLFEAAQNCIESWPTEIPGVQMELPLLGSVIPFYTPIQSTPLLSHFQDLPLCEDLDSLLEGHDQVFPGLFQDICLYSTLGHQVCTRHLWHLWELVITGESILVIADTPALSSEAALALVSLIAPLTYNGDFRPYFTIFDADFKEFQAQNDENAIAQSILGTTNPFFLKVLNNWPNVLHLDQKMNNLIHVQYCLLRLKTRTHSQVSPHKQTLNNLMKSSTKESIAINNSILRRHFRELTMALLQPLEKFYVLNLSYLRDSPYMEPPKFRPFDLYDFLRDMNNQKKIFPLLKYTSRDKAITLYERFLNTPLFRSWLTSQQQHAQLDAQNQVQTAMLGFDIHRAVQEMDHTQANALYQRIELELKRLQRGVGNETAILKLKKQLSVLLSKLQGTQEEHPYSVFS